MDRSEMPNLRSQERVNEVDLDPERTNVFRQRVTELLDLTSGYVSREDSKHRRNGLEGGHGALVREMARNLARELVQGPGPFRLLARAPLVVVEAAHQQGELSPEMNGE